MGWASGSQLAEDVWQAVRTFVPQGNRKTVARRIVGLFEEHDCDTLDEAESLVSDAALPEYSREVDL